jgi:hypothetical protein
MWVKVLTIPVNSDFSTFVGFFIYHWELPKMRKLFISQESVAFQDPMFFKELTLAFSELKKVNKTELADSGTSATVRAIVKKHTGLSIYLELGSQGPAVDIPAIDKNNVLVNSFIRGYVSSSDGLKLINDAKDCVRGTVSMADGKVSGIFAEIESKIYFPIEMFLGSKYEPEEIAAVMLHEIGHLFTYYEFITRTVTSNQVLAGVSKSLDGSGTIESREAVLTTAAKALRLKDLDVKALAKSTDKQTVEVVIVTNIVKTSESELGANVCDFSTWEYLADQYVARYGAGKHLVIALDKVYRGSWNISFRSTPAFLAFEAFKLLLLVSTIMVGVPVLAFFVFAMDSQGDGTYDAPGARMKRVRNQIVENLKDTKLSKDDRKKLLDDLEVIDSMLSEVNDRRQLIGVLWDCITKSNRSNRSQLLLQQDLEELVANDLFVNAAKLKALA